MEGRSFSREARRSQEARATHRDRGGVRAVVEAAGISDILTKSLGSSNILNVVYATIDALDQLKTPHEMAALRGKSPKELMPFWERRKQNG